MLTELEDSEIAISLNDLRDLLRGVVLDAVDRLEEYEDFVLLHNSLTLSTLEGISAELAIQHAERWSDIPEPFIHPVV